MKEGKVMTKVILVTGAGQLSMAIARRIGFGYKIIMGISLFPMRKPLLTS